MKSKIIDKDKYHFFPRYSSHNQKWTIHYVRKWIYKMVPLILTGIFTSSLRQYEISECKGYVFKVIGFTEFSSKEDAEQYINEWPDKYKVADYGYVIKIEKETNA